MELDWYECVRTNMPTGTFPLPGTNCSEPTTDHRTIIPSQNTKLILIFDQDAEQEHKPGPGRSFVQCYDRLGYYIGPGLA